MSSCAHRDASNPAGPLLIKEGSVEVLLRDGQKTLQSGGGDVFYNPAQVFNRDLSLVVLTAFARLRCEERAKQKEQKAEHVRERASPKATEMRHRPSGLLVLEALAATGIRSIRYAKELGVGTDKLHKIVANDLDPEASRQIKENILRNGIPGNLIDVTCCDAAGHMYAHRARGPGGCGQCAYDVIDIDPYGTAAPFIDAAIQAVADGGMLCITSTDMPVLGGNYPETSFARYGGSTVKAGFVHEMSLRLLLQAVAASAARYGRTIQSLMACSVDFYVRVFVRVFDSAAGAKLLSSKTAVVHQCVQCDSFYVQNFGEAKEGHSGSVKFRPARVTLPGTHCQECGGELQVGGPFYGAPLYDVQFLQSCMSLSGDAGAPHIAMLTSWKRINGIMLAMTEELQDIPLYYRVSQLCKSIKVIPIPLRTFRGTLASLGYRASHFHREPEGLKTDAPNHIVYDLLRCWAAENPPMNNASPKLLQKPLTLEKASVIWTAEEKGKRAPKFVPPPERNWGPKSKAKGNPLERTAEAAVAGEPLKQMQWKRGVPICCPNVCWDWLPNLFQVGHKYRKAIAPYADT